MRNFQAAEKTWLLILGVHLHPVHPAYATVPRAFAYHLIWSSVQLQTIASKCIPSFSTFETPAKFLSACKVRSGLCLW